MRMVIPQWQDRVSPVFDVAANLLLIDVEESREIGRQEVALPATNDPARRAHQVAQLQASILICGAISWPLETALNAAGVQVISQICGQVNDVIQSFLIGDLANDAFRMPGCCRRRRFRGGRGGGCSRENEPQRAGERGTRQRRMHRHRREL
ncbi:MAG TPA: NifB/NifX family molybdenum-iron cluster-binding protein [Phycisphaerae bacterium]|nr:NifB/NifX family molybdenum-iron cluster-binding protein [Phycisphaerae bacterium]